MYVVRVSLGCHKPTCHFEFHRILPASVMPATERVSKRHAVWDAIESVSPATTPLCAVDTEIFHTSETTSSMYHNAFYAVFSLQRCYSYDTIEHKCACSLLPKHDLYRHMRISGLHRNSAEKLKLQGKIPRSLTTDSCFTKTGTCRKGTPCHR